MVVGAGIHIGDVAGQLGHASLSTTTRYVDRAPNHRRESFRRVGVDKMIYIIGNFKTHYN